jgi:hypothetical protein
VDRGFGASHQNISQCEYRLISRAEILSYMKGGDVDANSRSATWRTSMWESGIGEMRGAVVGKPLRSEPSLKDMEHRAEHYLELFSAISRPTV